MNQTFKKIIQYIWFLRGRFPFLNFPLPVFLPFGSLYLAYGDGMGLMFFFSRPYEENEWRFIYKFLTPGMIFFDVGANQGVYTLLAAKKVGPSGKVFSFEPVPSQIKKLKRNIKINGFRNVVAEQLALGSKKCFANMHVCLNGDEALSSLRPPSEDINSRKKIIEVLITSIDDYVKNMYIKSINFIKIDVEGGELNVLKGAINTIKNFRPIFMCEVQDKRTLQWGYSASEICNFMRERNYSWFKVSNGGRLEAYLLSKVHNLGENLIAIPNEKVGIIDELY